MPTDQSYKGKTQSPSSPATANAPPPATDGLSLPLPPVALDFAIRGDATREGFLQRYLRKGDTQDASSAVVGKGGFGTAYRFVRDDSFTPPNSMFDTNNSGDTRQVDSGEEESIEALKRVPCHTDTMFDHDAGQSLTEGALRELHDSRAESCEVRYKQRLSHSISSSVTSSMPSSPSRRTAHRSRAPAVIVVKVCRTPTSGSYDELPKTGLGREEAKVAAHELAGGNPMGEHTRIVRGEARLLRFLQMAQSLNKRKGQQSYVVRLLANIPLPKPGDTIDDDEEQSGPPVPRLLIFERLVDLDAELTPRGWAKIKRLWTVEKVESVSRDVMNGLQFLHDHHVVHGDLKPSNFMRDPKTGYVKLIDLGASRRWVRLPNISKERTSAVEELDQAIKDGLALLARPGEILSEGLGSLTGSPHFMAPEVLLQASRYLSADGMARSVLEDYMMDRSQLPNVPSAMLLDAAFRDFKRGWGIKADIWSWGCSVISLLLRTLPAEERPSSNSICAFDFSFESDEDSLIPTWPLHTSNDSLPRFHQWARLYPLRIMSVLQRGVSLPDMTCVFSTPMYRMLHSTFQQQDARPTAAVIAQYLDTNMPARVETMARAGSATVGESTSGQNAANSIHAAEMYRRPSLSRSCTSVNTACVSLPDEPHNVDLSGSVAMSFGASMNGNDAGAARLYGSQQSFIILDPPPKLKGARSGQGAKGSAIGPQQKYLQNRLIHSPLASPGLLSPGPVSPIWRVPQHSPNSIAMDLSPSHTPQRSQPSTQLPKATHSGSLSSPRPVSRRTSSLVDEVFLDAFQKEESKMSPVLPLPITERIRQGDTHLMAPSFSDHGTHKSPSPARAPLRSPGSGREEMGRLKPQLSFPSLKPRRSSFISRVASHIGPRNSHHAPQQPCEQDQTTMQSDRNEGGSRDMLVDKTEEEKENLEEMGTETVSIIGQHGPPSLIHGSTPRASSEQWVGDQATQGTASVRSSPALPQSPLTPTSVVRMRDTSSSSSLSTPHQRAVSSSSASHRMYAGGNSSQQGAISVGGRTHKTSILGLGLDLHMPLRTVKSFTSMRGGGSMTSSRGSQPMPHGSCTPRDSPSKGHGGGGPDDALPRSSLNDFLLHDPYPHDSSRQLPPNHSQPKRGRSWSSIFRRKKV